MNTTVRRYFEAFNARDVDAMLDCLSEDVDHHVNEGGIRTGKPAFAAFCAHMNRCYDETLTNIVIFDAPDHARAAAEYVVNGTYISTDEGLPEAAGQKYCLPAGSFFEVQNGLITRVTTRYNLSDWIRQISA